MSYQEIQQITNGTLSQGFKFAAATAAVLIMTVFTVGTASAGTAANQTQNVNVVNTPTVSVGNTPTVNVGNTPSVTVTNTPSVNVANTPTVSLSGTPTVYANATITAPGPLTNVGRLPSQHVSLYSSSATVCPSTWLQVNSDGSSSCFDMANHSGEVLVITDFSWIASTTGTTCVMGITPSSSGNLTYFESTAAAGSDGIAAKSEHLTTGIPVSFNPQLSQVFTAPVQMKPCLSGFDTITGYLMLNQ